LSRLSPQAISGLLVLLAGLSVVYLVATGQSEVPTSSAPEAVSLPATLVVEVQPPSLEGVDLAVQRVLYASGKAEALRVDELTELAPEVARVLVYYRATLTIPAGPAG